MTPQNLPNRLRDWVSPIVYLSNNAISTVGVILVTSATVFWLYLLPSGSAGLASNPYIGIAMIMVLPSVFFLGLLLIPLGTWLRWRRERAAKLWPPVLPAPDFKNPKVRRLVYFIGAATFVNLIIASQFSYSAVNYMDSVSFCGKTCHTVMQPEYTAYLNSPHSRVECVKCHIGPGASWFVRSKLSGTWQVIAVTFNLYSRPIPTPVRNLRPARETCETCHWPQKFEEDRLRVIPSYADDATNSKTESVLLMRIGGGDRGRGIHGAHLGQGVTIRYFPADESRQTIPRVEYTKNGQTTVYTSADAKPEALKNLTVSRVMDCMDCHNRPTHTFELPERAVNNAMATGAISPALPFIKKESVALLKAAYLTREDAGHRIPAGLEQYYRQNYAAQYPTMQKDIARASRAILAIYDRNIFPAMRVAWGSYPNDLGHTDFPGCFRCHDDNHVSADGTKKVTQDCNACHQLLSMDETNPKVLTDLGMK